jgi:hypothetical protein
MTQRLIRSCLVFAVVLFCSAVSAQTNFNYSVNCAQATVGPITLDSGGLSSSGSVNLTPNVVSGGTILGLPTNITTNSNTVASGIFNGTLACSVTFGGVTVNYTRALVLTVIPTGAPAVSRQVF